LDWLEPDEGKLSRPVLRGGSGSNAALLPDRNNYKVGGPATAGCGWVPEFIHFCQTNGAPVDFVSTHTYGVESGYLDETATHGTALSRNLNSI